MKVEGDEEKVLEFQEHNDSEFFNVRFEKRVKRSAHLVNGVITLNETIDDIEFCIVENCWLRKSSIIIHNQISHEQINLIRILSVKSDLLKSPPFNSLNLTNVSFNDFFTNNIRTVILQNLIHFICFLKPQKSVVNLFE